MVYASNFNAFSIRDEEIASKMKKGSNESEEDYEDDIKGIPIRRKRNIRNDKTTVNNSNDKYKHLISDLDKLEQSMLKNGKQNRRSLNTFQNIGHITDSTFMKLIISCTSS